MLNEPLCYVNFQLVKVFIGRYMFNIRSMLYTAQTKAFGLKALVNTMHLRPILAKDSNTNTS